MAAISKGQKGHELTEMAELADVGAVGFTDDGLPVRSAGLMRLALQYQRLCGGVLALHEEDPDLSGAGVMHEGAVSATLGMAGIPAVSESTMIARDAELAGYEDGRIHIQHLSARRSVEVIEAAKAAGVKITCEASPHHLTLTDEAVRSLDANFKMNPPLRSEDDRQALIEGLRSGLIDCVATDHAPALARGEGAALRARPDGRDRARDLLRRAQHRARDPGPARPSDPCRPDELRGGPLRAADSRDRGRMPRPTSAWSTWPASGRWGRAATRAAPPTPASQGAPSRAGFA